MHHHFKDIEENQWSRKHIATLLRLGIVEGYRGDFRPFDNITKSELVTMVIRLSNLSNETNNQLEVNETNTLLDDIKGHWCKKNINLAESKGWIKGYQDGTFRPKNDITRAEFVTVVNNALNRRIKKSEIPFNIKVFNDLQEEQWYYKVILEASNNHYYERNQMDMKYGKGSMMEE